MIIRDDGWYHNSWPHYGSVAIILWKLFLIMSFWKLGIQHLNEIFIILIPCRQSNSIRLIRTIVPEQEQLGHICIPPGYFGLTVSYYMSAWTILYKYNLLLLHFVKQRSSLVSWHRSIITINCQANIAGQSSYVTNGYGLLSISENNIGVD